MKGLDEVMADQRRQGKVWSVTRADSQADSQLEALVRVQVLTVEIPAGIQSFRHFKENKKGRSMSETRIGSQQDYTDFTPNCTDSVIAPVFLRLDHPFERIFGYVKWQ